MNKEQLKTLYNTYVMIALDVETNLSPALQMAQSSLRIYFEGLKKDYEEAKRAREEANEEV